MTEIALTSRVPLAARRAFALFAAHVGEPISSRDISNVVIPHSLSPHVYVRGLVCKLRAALPPGLGITYDHHLGGYVLSRKP